MCLKVFCYGSNMCQTRIRARVATARTCRIGYITGYRLELHKRGLDGSAKADAFYTGRSGDVVWGVVMSISPSDKPLLDSHESLGVGYDEQVVDVTAPDRSSLKAWMYVARREAVDSSLLPYSWYVDFMIAGATQHGLPDEYRRDLQAIRHIADSDTERHESNQRLIESTADRIEP